jgi:peptide deformylase
MPLDIITIEQSDQSKTLTQPASEVSFPLSKENLALISQMKAILDQNKGVGLAAPQVGHSQKIIVYVISEEAIALRKDAKEVVPMTVLINPSYKPIAGASLVQDWEGCFSVAKTYGKVPRYTKISYSAKLIDGTPIQAEASGFTARVLQHEIDHVEGKLILDRLTPECLQGEPQDMMPIRLSEFTPEQREIAQRLLTANRSSTKTK